MKRVLTTAVPRFLAQLRADYEIWAAGEEEQRAGGARQAVHAGDGDEKFQFGRHGGRLCR